MGKGRIGPDQCDGGGRQQHDAADGLDVQETVQGGEGAFGEQMRARQVPGTVRVLVHDAGILRGGPPRAMNLSRRPMRPTHSRYSTNDDSGRRRFPGGPPKACSFVWLPTTSVLIPSPTRMTPTPPRP